MTATNLVRCHVCGGVLPREDATKIDEVKTPHGLHWAWAHLACVPGSDKELEG